MRKTVLISGIVSLVVLVGLGILFLASQQKETMIVTEEVTIPQSPTPDAEIISDAERITVLAQHLDTPWAMTFLPDKSLFVTERKGTVWHIPTDWSFSPRMIATLPSVKEIGEGGLLGITLHPDFENNKYVYLYYTYNSTGDETRNRVVRTTYQNNRLEDETVILDAIPGAPNHNGGRIAFGPDGFLYITTGDAQEPSQAQNTKTLGGKILRVTDTGEAAPGNPFDNEIYSYGHRNAQGITWDANGNLWATEHGRSGLQSGLDELNRIEKGNNYGWPTIQGDETRPGMVTPVANSGAITTWAPGGITSLNGSLYFTGLRGKSLYKVTFQGNIPTVTEYLVNEFGRIREVIVGPDGLLYITTSNRDGRGTPTADDDKIIRVNPSKL